MNSLSGFIKLHRKLVAWGWYQDYVVKDVFLHLLLTANFKRTEWQGRTLEEGQVVIGYQKLSEELGFGVQRIRTAIKKLKSTNEITTESTSKYTVVTIVNWREYQSNDDFTNTASNTKTNKQLTNNQQTTNKQLTNNQQQRKNDKNDKNKRMVRRERGALSPHGQFLNVFLSEAEVSDLAEKYPHDYERKIERLSRYIESNGKDYPDHYIKLLNWLEDDVGKAGQSSQDGTTARSYNIDELDKFETLDDLVGDF